MRAAARAFGPYCIFLVIVCWFGGFVHVVYGGGGGLRLCQKTGWTLEDTFVDLADYAGKPVMSLIDKAKVLRGLVNCGLMEDPKVPAAQPTTVEPAAISVSDFQIVSYRTVREFDSLMVKGEVKNNGTVPAGVELEAIARDDKGAAIDSARFWPNSVSNIPPGGTVGISHTVSHGPFAKTIDLQIASVREWGSR